MKLHGQASNIHTIWLNLAGLLVERNPSPEDLFHLWVSPWSSGEWIKTNLNICGN